MANKKNETPVTETFSIDAYLGNVIGIHKSAEELRAEIVDDAQGCVDFTNENDPAMATIVDQAVDRVLSEYGLSIVTLTNARMTPTAVIARPSDQTNGKERWLVYARLVSATDRGGNKITIVAPRSYLSDKIAGFVSEKTALAGQTFAALKK